MSEDIYAEALTLFDNSNIAVELLKRLRSDNLQIARDQLRAMIKLRKKFSEETWAVAIASILALPVLKATLIEAVLESYHRRKMAKALDEKTPATLTPGSALDRPLQRY
jgi:hypothetical protein